MKINQQPQLSHLGADGNSKRAACSCRAFTLVEVLIVIAIIAVLFALGMPGIKRMVRAANQVKCTANLRQIGTLLHVYDADHDGLTVPAYTNHMVDGENYGNTWGEVINDWYNVSEKTYGKTYNNRVGKCPENRFQKSPLIGAGSGEIETSYSINGWAEISPGGLASDNRYAGNRTCTFEQPSRLYMVTEATYYRTEQHKDDGSGSLPAGLYKKGLANMRYAHDGRVNMVFADGHAELLQGPLLGQGFYRGGAPNKAASYSNGKCWFAN